MKHNFAMFFITFLKTYVNLNAMKQSFNQYKMLYWYKRNNDCYE